MYLDADCILIQGVYAALNPYSKSCNFCRASKQHMRPQGHMYCFQNGCKAHNHNYQNQSVKGQRIGININICMSLLSIYRFTDFFKTRLGNCYELSLVCGRSPLALYYCHLFPFTLLSQSWKPQQGSTCTSPDDLGTRPPHQGSHFAQPRPLAQQSNIHLWRGREGQCFSKCYFGEPGAQSSVGSPETQRTAGRAESAQPDSLRYPGTF